MSAEPAPELSIVIPCYNEEDNVRAIHGAVNLARKQGAKVSRAHLHHLNPFPKNLGDVLKGYRKVLVPEMNLGQLSRLLRAEYLVDAQSYTQVNGLPFRAADMEARIMEELAR